MSFTNPTFSASDLDAAATPAVVGLLSAPDWASSSPTIRRGRVLDTLRGLAVIGDWFINQGGALVQIIVDEIAEFSGPTIPDKTLPEWTEEWWYRTVGTPISWGVALPEIGQ